MKSSTKTGLDLPFLGKSVGEWMQLASTKETNDSNADEVSAARLYIYAC